MNPLVIPLTRPSNNELWCSLLISTWTNCWKETAESLLIWHAMTLIWHHYNGMHMNGISVYKVYPKKKKHAQASLSIAVIWHRSLVSITIYFWDRSLAPWQSYDSPNTNGTSLGPENNGKDDIQSGAVVTRSNPSRYHIRHCDKSDRKWIRY